ncbi:Hypothetical protein ETEE_0756 [Edwardsiella anguillarum ET080813]|uniref:Uncharacterized protein n=1 Tax=Edwardsiella anguillarum ET080813 TaxID=667120 RepID=A0A076LK81_9GAMM|nr:Hypothetical protein ETEE_0756 [Edwardsiella anguillarum ET080813]
MRSVTGGGIAWRFHVSSAAAAACSPCDRAPGGEPGGPDSAIIA